MATDNPESNNDRRSSRTPVAHRIAVNTAWVAGVFSATVCLFLLDDFSQRQAKDPLESARFKVLKDELAERFGPSTAENNKPRPDLDDLKAHVLTLDVEALGQQARQLDLGELKEVIRDLDLRLRQQYFRQRRFTATGGLLLLGGLVVFALAVKSAVTLKRKIPMPEQGGVPVDRESASTRLGGWAVAGLILILIAGVVAMSRSLRSPLSTDLDGAAVAVRPDQSMSSPGAAVDPGVTNKEPSPRTSSQVAPGPKVKPVANAETQEDGIWPRFRGPGGLGISNHKDIPTTWDGDSGDGILWKTPVPLPGNNSPVVCSGRVFLTGANEAEREVYCFGADTGELLWQVDVPVTPEGTGEPLELMEDTGHAASTTTTDGHHVFAMFPNGDVVALDLDGNQVWIRGLGIPENAYGHASSLAMHRDRLIVQFDQGSRDDELSRLLALDGATGATVWETKRAVPNSWPTPIIVQVGQRDQIITGTDPWLLANDPEDGQEIWRAKCLSQDVGPSPTFADGIVYVATEYAVLSAVRADGEGDVTETHILWEGEDGLPDTASPLATEKYVYVLASFGILTCYDAKSGEMLWDKEVEDVTFTSSPSLVGDLLYLFGEIEEETESGDWVRKCRAWVLKPGDEGCELVGEGSLPEGCVTSPAFQDGRLYIRGKDNLYCIGKDTTSTDKVETGADTQVAHNWPRFRGPGGLGVSGHKDVPTSWNSDSGDGILWKEPVSLPGNNSPVLWGDRVFLTGADETERRIYSFETDTGHVVWEKDVPVTPEGTGDPQELMEGTGYAASTTTTDGQHVFAMFPNGDVVALDFDGSQVWIRGLGIPKNTYGHASSLAMYRDRLIVQFDQGSRDDELSKLMALDGATGATVWETKRAVPNSWPTPIIVQVGQRDQIITGTDPWLLANDPKDGREIWRAKCLSQDVGPSPTFADGIVYVATEYAVLSAVRADGEGDVTETHILWEGEDGLPDTASPLATEKYVYLLASFGILTCYDAKSGEMLWDKEFEDVTFTSSPSLVGDLLYLFGEIEEETESGDWVRKCRAWVLKPGDEGCELVGEGSLPEGCVTSPAFRDGRLYIRGKDNLYCIGKE